MSNTPRNLTRNQLAEFLPNQRAVRAFEQLLKQGADLNPADLATLTRLVQEASIEASQGVSHAQSVDEQLGAAKQDLSLSVGIADSKANQALDSLNRIAFALESLVSAPAVQNNNSFATDYVDFALSPNYSATPGRVHWGQNGTLEIEMGNGNITQQVGEEFFRYGKASTAISDTNLQLVYKTGVVGASGVITFAPAVAGITDPDQILGIATESIAINGFGRITTMGVVHGVNTTGSVYGEVWADNDDIWYNPVTGGLTKTKPVAPNVKVQVGTVINAGGGGSGSFSVKIGSSSSLGGTDSNVQLGTLADKQLLQYDSVAGYWKNVAASAIAEPPISSGTTAQYWRGDKTWQTLNTAAVAESTNLYYTDARVRAAVLTGYAVGSNTALAATDTVLSAFGKVQGQINAKEPSVAAGTTAQYWRGDKTWQDFFTSVRAATLTGLSTATSAVITATDTVLSALGKLQAQLSALGTASTTDYSTGTWTPVATATIPGITPPTIVSASGTYTKIGRTVYCTYNILFGSNGTGAGQIKLTGNPFTPSQRGFGTGIETDVLGFNTMSQTIAGTDATYIGKTDTTYPGGTSYRLMGNFTYIT